jgi:rhodanese-related sulfurtransferase
MQDITVEELKTRLDKGENIVIIDVREPWEFEEFNIDGRLIPLSNLPDSLELLEPYKDSELVVHCRSGARSATAKAFLTQQGFTKVRNMLGGAVAWQSMFGG